MLMNAVFLRTVHCLIYQSLSLGLHSCDAGYSTDYLACWLISFVSNLTSAQHLEGLRMDTLSQLPIRKYGY